MEWEYLLLHGTPALSGASDPGDELARQRLVERELQGSLAGQVRRELALEVVVLGTELGTG